jgi:hypothetical protein
MSAVDSGNVKCINILCSNGADVNVESSYGWTALNWAVIQNKSACVDAILSLGADINSSNYNGTTALMFAAATGNKGMVKMLCDKGANVNARTNDGTSALMLATRLDSVARMHILYGRGVDINYVEPADETVAAKAAINDSSDCAQVLLSFGAHADIEKDDALTVETATKQSSSLAPEIAVSKSRTWIRGHALQLAWDACVVIVVCAALMASTLRAGHVLLLAGADKSAVQGREYASAVPKNRIGGYQGVHKVVSSTYPWAGNAYLAISDAGIIRGMTFLRTPDGSRFTNYIAGKVMSNGFVKLTCDSRRIGLAGPLIQRHLLSAIGTLRRKGDSMMLEASGMGDNGRIEVIAASMPFRPR